MNNGNCAGCILLGTYGLSYSFNAALAVLAEVVVYQLYLGKVNCDAKSTCSRFCANLDLKDSCYLEFLLCHISDVGALSNCDNVV